MKIKVIASFAFAGFLLGYILGSRTGIAAFGDAWNGGLVFGIIAMFVGGLLAVPAMDLLARRFGTRKSDLDRRSDP